MTEKTESGSIENASSPIEERCLNCQLTLTGPFCSRCGQARSARLIPFKTWVGDFLAGFLELDSNLLRTLKRVFFQPGQATVDFAEGRRVAFTGPVKVYIIVSAISIATMSLWGAVSPENAQLAQGSNADPDFQDRVQFLFPFANLLSPFLTAGVLAVFHRGLFYQLHLAFSLHFWTFFVAIGTPLIFIPPTSVWALVALGIIMLLVTGYVFLAHRRVYAASMLTRFVSAGAVLLSVPIASLLIFQLMILLASQL